jgi:threonine dehydrogenase-like Zn-dependent dehydrogenase
VAAGELLGAGTAASGEYDVVVDAAGTSSAVATAIDHARPGGLLSAPAVYWDPLTIPNAVTLVVKEVRVQPSYTYGHHHGVREVDEAAALLGIVPELAGAVVTHRFGLDDAPEAFRVAADRASGAIKVVLEP